MRHRLLGNDGLTFFDFYPKEKESKATCPGHSRYERFSDLVSRANKWLGENPQWKVKTCETVERNADEQDGRMDYHLKREHQYNFFRFLRLWVVPCPEEVCSQTINFIHLIPQKIRDSKHFKKPVFQTLDDVLEEFNYNHHYRGFPGHLMSMETLELANVDYTDFDPEQTRWKRCIDDHSMSLYVLRIWYESGSPPVVEEIGAKDFVPEKISESLHKTKHESMADLMNRASDWLSKNTWLRVCNAQSMEIKLKSGSEINTKKMFHLHHDDCARFVNILRVSYIKVPEYDGLMPLLSSGRSDLRLNCKTFLPLPKDEAPGQYESLSEMRDRIEHWVHGKDLQVLCVETSALQLNRLSEIVHPKIVFHKDAKTESRTWMKLIRLYVQEASGRDLCSSPPKSLNRGFSCFE